MNIETYIEILGRLEGELMSRYNITLDDTQDDDWRELFDQHAYNNFMNKYIAPFKRDAFIKDVVAHNTQVEMLYNFVD